MTDPHDLPRFRDELRATIRLASPLAAASLAQIGMGLTDTVLLGGLGRDALAAGGLGVSIFQTLSAILQGLVVGVSILIAHARGEGKPEKIAPILGAGYIVATLSSLPLIVLLWWIEPALQVIGEPEALAHAVARYDRIIVLGVPASLWLAVQRSYLTAMNRPRVVMTVSICALVANGFLNYGLMHGAWGLPEMGYLGSATATTAALWGMFGATALWSGAPAQVRIDRAATAPAVFELVHLGWPIAGTLAVEILLFTGGALMAGVLGPTALAAHQVAISVASTTFMVPMSIGQAANVRVGYFAGARVWAAARRAGHAAFAVGVGFMAIAALVLLVFPRQIAPLFNLDPANPNDAGVIALIVRLLVITAFFQVFDGAQTIAAGALRGYKDTRMPMALAGFGYWALGFPVAWVLAFPMGLGAVGIWWGFAIGLAATALVLGWRYERLSVTLIAQAAA